MQGITQTLLQLRAISFNSVCKLVRLSVYKCISFFASALNVFVTAFNLVTHVFQLYLESERCCSSANRLSQISHHSKGGEGESIAQPVREESPSALQQ